MVETIVLVTGGFDPIHSGHIAYFKSAKKLGDKLIVGVNSDEWLVNKKGSSFLPLDERIQIVSNLSVVDETIKFQDDEYESASNAITTVIKKYPEHKIIFANGGDRTSENIPEMKMCIRKVINPEGLKKLKFVFWYKIFWYKSINPWIPIPVPWIDRNPSLL